jgi:cbb3-type cytochrome oxidase subunit 1
MFSDLTLAGIFQGYYWSSMQPWDVSVDGSQPFWIIRLFAGLGIIFGQLCFFYNIYRTYRLGPRIDVQPEGVAPVLIRESNGLATREAVEDEG